MRDAMTPKQKLYRTAQIKATGAHVAVRDAFTFDGEPDRWYYNVYLEANVFIGVFEADDLTRFVL